MSHIFSPEKAVSYVAFFVFLVFVSGMLHEIGHLIFLGIYGIPSFDFRSDLSSGSLFLFSHGSIEDNFALSVVRYSGGIFSSFVLVSIYVLGRNFFNANFIFGIILLLIMGMHFSQGVIEGAFNTDYFSSGLLYAPIHVNLISMTCMLIGPIALIKYRKDFQKKTKL